MERIITEGLDLPTRTIVRDIIKIVRTGEVGSYELPLELSGEDRYKHDLSVYYYPELLYDLIADLNDIVRHEYEHHMQNLGYRPDKESGFVDIENQPTNYKYYLQPHEIPAVLQGLRRVMKLRKISLEDALDDWYKRTFDKESMKKTDYNKLKKELGKEYDKRYGKK